MRKGTPLASRVAQGVSGPSSSCVWNPRGFADAGGWGKLATGSRPDPGWLTAPHASAITESEGPHIHVQGVVILPPPPGVPSVDTWVNGEGLLL